MKKLTIMFLMVITLNADNQVISQKLLNYMAECNTQSINTDYMTVCHIGAGADKAEARKNANQNMDALKKSLLTNTRNVMTTHTGFSISNVVVHGGFLKLARKANDCKQFDDQLICQYTVKIYNYEMYRFDPKTGKVVFKD